jgi:hypothetical protein
MSSEFASVSWSSLGVSAMLVAVACSAAQPSSGLPQGSGGSGQANAGTGGSIAPAGSGGVPGSGGTVSIDVPGGGSNGAGTAGMESCATQEADAMIVRQPVDVIVVIDNSGSMQDEIDAVEQSINVDFANILSASGVDYRVILLSRHEKLNRQTSICVLAPLSGATSCPPTPDMPVFSERFYQYSLKVDSLNSLVLLIDTYDATEPDEFGLAPTGWSAWLRPAAKKVFLEITDDNSTEMTATEFESQLFALSPEHFGSADARKYVFHSIIGIGEKSTVTDPWLPEEAIQTSLCTGNDDTVENAGPVYQELSRLTGGLRFPLCQFTEFDVVFETIANNVTSQASIACEFPIPPAPADRELDLSKVAVSYDPGDGSGTKTFGQAMSAEQCVPDAFYIDEATRQIRLCPAACTSVQAGLQPTIDVLFTCEPTYVPPPK